MTGSAVQALGVELTCESSCKGRGVRGEGGGRLRPAGGRRMTGSAVQALGVLLTCESSCKGRGVRGEGGGGLPRDGRAGGFPWRSKKHGRRGVFVTFDLN